LNLNVVLLGPPGAGKGTQTRHIANKFGLFQLSTGDLIRKEINTESELGKAIKEVVNSGGLTVDAHINELVRECVKAQAPLQGVVFDGYPRRVAQAEFLDQLLKEIGLKIDLAIHLVIDDSLLVKRVSGRFTCSSCGAMYHEEFNLPSQKDVCDVCGHNTLLRRPDDSVEALKLRLALYHKETEPIVNYYQTKGILSSIDGTQPIEKVAEAVERLILRTQQQLKR
jgi:adenylate kinase